MRELKKITVTRVDMVDHPANEREFPLFKAANGDPDAAAKAKADAAAAEKVKTDADAAAEAEKAKTEALEKADAEKAKTAATTQAEVIAKVVQAELAKLPAFAKAEATAKAEKFSGAIKSIEGAVGVLKSLGSAPEAKAKDDTKPVAKDEEGKDKSTKVEGKDEDDEEEFEVPDELVKMVADLVKAGSTDELKKLAKDAGIA